MARDLAVAYGARALAGTFAAAVIPVALAQAAENGDAMARARRFAWLSAAATVGFLSGPVLGGWLAGISMAMPQAEMVLGGPEAWPFAVTAGLAAAVWAVAYRRLPDRPPPSEPAAGGPPARSATRSTGVLLALTLVAMLGLGAFEVGLSLQAGQVLGLDPFRVGLLFTVCSLVMLAMQILWSIRPLQRLLPSRLIGGAFLLLAVGVSGLSYAGDLRAAIAVVGLAGAGTGVLIPLLAYELSLLSEGVQGKALGTQTGLASLGQAGGSAGAGLLFEGRALIGYRGLAALLLGVAVAGLALRRRRDMRA